MFLRTRLYPSPRSVPRVSWTDLSGAIVDATLAGHIGTRSAIDEAAKSWSRKFRYVDFDEVSGEEPHHARRYPQAAVGLVTETDGGMIVGDGECGDLVHVRVAASGCVRATEVAPTVPGQHLDLVQRGEIACDVPRDEPLAPHVKNPEAIAVLLAALAPKPGRSGWQETAWREVGRIVGEPDCFA